MATVLTTSGKGIITNRIKGSGTEPLYIGWGTGAGTAAVGDTALATEDTTGGYTRATGTSSRVTTSVTNDTYQVVGTLTAGASLTITNAGTFDAVSGGNICVHGDFTGIALASGDSIQFTIKVQLT
jgi:hypothetical protein